MSIVKLLIQSDIQSLANELAESLINDPNVTNNNAADIRSKVDEVTDNITKSTVPVMNKMNELIKNTFSIPDFVVLPGDRFKSKYNEADEESLNEKFEQLNLSYKQVKSSFNNYIDKLITISMYLFPTRIYNL